jgi:hypothetical protein
MRQHHGDVDPLANVPGHRNQPGIPLQRRDLGMLLGAQKLLELLSCHHSSVPAAGRSISADLTRHRRSWRLKG